MKRNFSLSKRTYSSSLNVLFEEFCFKKLSEGRSCRTIEQYRESYTSFSKYLDMRGIANQPDKITVRVIREYIVWLRQEKIRFDGHYFKTKASKTVGLSPVTINTYMKTLKVFFKFLLSEQHISVNPLVLIEKYKEPEEEVTILTRDELSKIINAPDRTTFAGFRDYILMSLMADSFLRINEVLSMQIGDIDFKNALITIRSGIAKNRRSRTVPTQKRIIMLIEELIKEAEVFDNDFVFLTDEGEQLSVSQARSRIRMWADRAGVTTRVYPHIFRHTGATLFLEAGGDIRHLQIIMGHRDIRMLARYTHPSTDSLKNQHEKFGVLNNIASRKSKYRL